MVIAAAIGVPIGFAVGIVKLVRRGVLIRRRADLVSLARVGNTTERSCAHNVLRSLRAPNLAALVAVVLGGVVAAALQEEFPDAAGLALAVAPAGIWVLAALAFAFWRLPHEATDPPADSVEQATAELLLPFAGKFGPAWGIMLPAALLMVTVLRLVGAGLASGTNQQGRHRNLPYVSPGYAEVERNMLVTGLQFGEGAVGAFPGWYYGVPVSALLLLGAFLGLWALNSHVRRPRIRGVHLQRFDDAVRTNAGYMISTGFSAMLFSRPHR